MKLNDKIIEVLEDNGFNAEDVHEQDGMYYIEIGQGTPEGEDWYECIWFDGTNQGFIKAVRELADNFDVDEAVEIWIPSRGKNGVPDSIEDLIEDAKWKQSMLETLADELEAIEIEEDTVRCRVRLTYSVELVVEGKSKEKIVNWLNYTTPKEAKEIAGDRAYEYYDEEILFETKEKADYVI